MITELSSPLSFSEVGARSHNEDSLYPTPEIENPVPGLYMVCDGVGGAKKGEIASQMVVSKMAEAFVEMPPPDPMAAGYLAAQLQKVETELQETIEDDVQHEGMATTLTLLHFDSEGATLAWAGDSRIYQFRGGKIHFRTEDHSLVSELVKKGTITEEQAESHPQRNIIMRAVKGAAHPVDLEIYRQNDLQTGDLFLLCSDGLLEQWKDADLAKLLWKEQNPEKIKAALLEKSTGQTRDNFTALMVQVIGQSTTQRSGAAGGPKKRRRFPVWILGLILVLALGGLGYWLGVREAKAERESKRLYQAANDAFKAQQYERTLSAYDSLLQLDPDTNYIGGKLRTTAQLQRDTAAARLARIEGFLKAAKKQLKEADKTKKYADYFRVIQLYEQALDIRPDAKVSSLRQKVADKLSQKEEVLGAEDLVTLLTAEAAGLVAQSDCILADRLFQRALGIAQKAKLDPLPEAIPCPPEAEAEADSEEENEGAETAPRSNTP